MRQKRSDEHGLEFGWRITTETRLKALMESGVDLVGRFVRVPSPTGGDQPTYVFIVDQAGVESVLAVTRSEGGIKLFPYSPSVLTFVKRFPKIKFDPIDITPESIVEFQDLKDRKFSKGGS